MEEGAVEIRNAVPIAPLLIRIYLTAIIFGSLAYLFMTYDADSCASKDTSLCQYIIWVMVTVIISILYDICLFRTISYDHLNWRIKTFLALLYLLYASLSITTRYKIDYCDKQPNVIKYFTLVISILNIHRIATYAMIVEYIWE
jgi:hypothetical protein